MMSFDMSYGEKNDTRHWIFVFMNEEELFMNNMHISLIIPQFNDNHEKQSFKALKDCKDVESYDAWLWYNNAWLEKYLLEMYPAEWHGWVWH